jgi:hypothetical protein
VAREGGQDGLEFLGTMRDGEIGKGRRREREREREGGRE